MDKEYRIIGSGNGLREKLDEKEFIHSFKDGEYIQRWGNRRIKLSVNSYIRINLTFSFQNGRESFRFWGHVLLLDFITYCEVMAKEKSHWIWSE
jgi:hypothetical protein